MPSLPNPGDTNWGTTLNTYLQVSLDTDGTIKDGAAVKSSTVTQIVSLSQVAYNALTPDASTLYVITS